jgi:hypothetical protein
LFPKIDPDSTDQSSGNLHFDTTDVDEVILIHPKTLDKNYFIKKEVTTSKTNEIQKAESGSGDDTDATTYVDSPQSPVFVGSAVKSLVCYETPHNSSEDEDWSMDGDRSKSEKQIVRIAETGESMEVSFDVSSIEGAKALNDTVSFDFILTNKSL